MSESTAMVREELDRREAAARAELDALDAKMAPYLDELRRCVEARKVLDDVEHLLGVVDEGMSKVGALLDLRIVPAFVAHLGPRDRGDESDTAPADEPGVAPAQVAFEDTILGPVPVETDSEPEPADSEPEPVDTEPEVDVAALVPVGAWPTPDAVDTPFKVARHQRHVAVAEQMIEAVRLGVDIRDHVRDHFGWVDSTAGQALRDCQVWLAKHPVPGLEVPKVTRRKPGPKPAPSPVPAPATSTSEPGRMVYWCGECEGPEGEFPSFSELNGHTLKVHKRRATTEERRPLRA